MNSMWKRSFALLLSLVMVFGMVPVNAFAEETECSHSYEKTVTDPTCTAVGYTTYTCACGDTYKADEVAATGHSYADGVCSVCGAEEPAVEEQNEEEDDEIVEEETEEDEIVEEEPVDDPCVALGCTDDAHAEGCPYTIPCDLNEGCKKHKGHYGECEGMIVYTEPVAEFNGVEYTSLQDALKAAEAGGTVKLLSNVTITEKWDNRSGGKFTGPVTINGNGKTLKFTGLVSDAGNYHAVFRFGAAATVEDLTFDMTEAQPDRGGRVRAISAAANLTVTNCKFLGNPKLTNARAIIFGEGSGSAISEVDVTVQNSEFSDWRRGLGDNENNGDVKSVTASGNTFKDAAVVVSAFDSITFTGNTVTGAENSEAVTIYSNTSNNGTAVTATGNNLEEGLVCVMKNGKAVDVQEEITVLPWGTLSKAFTSEYGIWGECSGNAEESFVLKFYSGDTYLGYTSLNDVNDIIDGDVTATWNILFDAASNTDEFWTMAWDGVAPSATKQPTRVEQWIDGVKVKECAIELNGPDGVNPLSVVLGGENGRIVKYEKSAADALTAAKNAGLTEVTIVLLGENTKDTADMFILYNEKVFDSVTLKQKDASKPYYFEELDTGSRTNDGKFVFDGVNLHVTGQYIFEGNVELTNNSVIASSAEANCFFYNNTTTIEPGSRLQGVIEEFRGGTVIVDGGKTDGTYSETPGLKDSIMTVSWNGDKLILKNGAYVNLNAANEVGRLTISAGTAVEVDASKLDAVEYIALAANGTLQVDTESQVKTPKITGRGKIVIDAKDYTPGKAVPINADVSAFTGTVETINSKLVKAVKQGDKIVFANAVAKIGDQGYYSLADALAAAKDGDKVELIWAEGDAPISMAGTVSGKTVTVTGTAQVDWSKDWLYVGRNGEGDGTLIFDKANLTSASNSRAYGWHVSGRKAGSTDTYNGTVVMNDSNIVLDYMINRGTVTVNGGSLTVKNGFQVMGRPASETEDGKDATATFTINNAAVTIKNANGMGIGGDEGNGILNINGGSFTAEQSMNVYANGTVNVDGATLSVANDLTNSGIINISGNSKVTAANVTGGTVNVAAGTVLTDTTLGGAATTKFANGEISFNGKNEITTGVSGSPFGLKVNEGATLLITRFTLGGGRNITVKGNIADASTFVPGDATPSLKANSTSGFSIGGTGVNTLTAKDAYLDFGSSSWKNATGKFDWTFENSYVKAASFGNMNPAGSADAAWTVTFDDSVLAASNIKPAAGVTYSFTNDSEAKTDSMRVDGVLNIDKTGSVTVTSQQNNEVGKADEHGDILGTVNVEGILVFENGGSDSIDLLGGKLNVLPTGVVNLGNKTLRTYENSELTVAVGSDFIAPAIKGTTGKIIIDAADYVPGMSVPVDADVSEFTGTVETINSKLVKAEIKDGRIVFVDAVAKVDNMGYYTLEAAIAAANGGKTVTLLTDIPANPETDAGLQITAPMNVDLNGHTLKADFNGTLTMNGGTYRNANGFRMISSETDSTYAYNSSDAVLNISATGIDITKGTMTIGLAGGMGTDPNHKLQLLNDAKLVIPEGKPLVLRSEAKVASTATVNGTILLEGNGTIITAKELSVASATNGYKVIYHGGKYQLVMNDVVAVVDGQYYNLNTALNNVEDNGTVTLIEDVAFAQITIAKPMTLNLNGKKLVGKVVVSQGKTVKIDTVNKNNVPYGIVLDGGDSVTGSDDGKLTVTAAKDTNSNYGSFLITKPDGANKTIARKVFLEQNAAFVAGSTTSFDVTKADFRGEYLLDKDGNGIISKTDIYSEFLDAAGNPMYAPSILKGEKVTIKVRNSAFLDTCTQIYVNNERVYNKQANIPTVNTSVKVYVGCTELELTADYVKNLPAGTHSVKFYHTIDGTDYITESKFTVYTVYNANADTTNPKTGDEIFVPMFVMFSTAAALAVLVMGKKKYF